MALLVRTRIAAGSQNHADRHAGIPLGTLLSQRSIRSRFEERQQVRTQPPHQHLRLGITPAAVELEHLRPLSCEHQPGKQHPTKSNSVLLNPRQKWIENLPANPLAQGLVHRSGWRNRPHAAGVRAEVSVKSLLVVAAVWQEQIRRAIHQRVDRALDAFQKFLHHDALPGRSERPILETHPHRPLRLGEVLGNDHALAEREPIGLHDQRVFCGAAKFQRLRAVGELPVIRSRDSMATHEFLRECLRGFESRGGSGWTKNFQPRFLKRIHDSGCQRVIRTDDGKINPVRLRKLDEFFDILRRDRDILPDLRGAGVPRRSVDFFDLRRLREFPCQRMLTTSGARDENPFLHRLNASVTGCAGSICLEKVTVVPCTPRTSPCDQFPADPIGITTFGCNCPSTA